MPKQEDLVRKSLDIIPAYYENDLDPFFENISDDVLWIGPRGGQILRGKDVIVKTWTADSGHGLVFTMGEVSAQTASTGKQNLEVLLEYEVYTNFPDGQTDRHHQRLHLSWGRFLVPTERRKENNAIAGARIQHFYCQTTGQPQSDGDPYLFNTSQYPALLDPILFILPSFDSLSSAL